MSSRIRRIISPARRRLNRTPFEEIVRHYHFTDRELLRYFIKLDRLKVIELQPGNKARLLVSRRFSWGAGGPVQKYIHQKRKYSGFAQFDRAAIRGPADRQALRGPAPRRPAPQRD